MRHRLERHAPEENFGAFALQQDLPPPRKHAAGFIHSDAVELHEDVVALANADEFVPLAARSFHVTRSAEIKFILPLPRLVQPVDAAPTLDIEGLPAVRECTERPTLCVSPGLDGDTDARRDERAVRVCPTNEEKVPGGSLHDLALDGRAKRAAPVVAVSVRADTVEEQ